MTLKKKKKSFEIVVEMKAYLCGLKNAGAAALIM